MTWSTAPTHEERVVALGEHLRACNAAEELGVPCSSEGCERNAWYWLRFAGMGDRLHVHVCSTHHAQDREWCDVIEGGVLPCPERLRCTVEPVLTQQPPLLDGAS